MTIIIAAPFLAGALCYAVLFVVALYSCSLPVFPTASDFRISFTDIVFTGSEDDPSMDVCTEIKNGQLGAGSHIDVNLTTNTLAISPDRFQAVGKC